MQYIPNDLRILLAKDEYFCVPNHHPILLTASDAAPRSRSA